MVTVKFVALVEKQKETISGESSDRSQKKKLGAVYCSVIHLACSFLAFGELQHILISFLSINPVVIMRQCASLL